MADFQSLKEEFDAEEISIIAGSVDTKEKAAETVSKNRISFPVAHGMDAEQTSRLTGAYYDRDRQYIHATGFLLRPDNTVETVCYSSGTIGRFVARDLLNLVKFYKSRSRG